MDRLKGSLPANSSANIYDVAREARCSIATISRALNNRQVVSEKTFNRIERAMILLNYSPNINAKNLARKKNNVTALLMPHHDEIHFSLVITSFLAGILNVSEKHHHRVMIFPTSDSHSNNGIKSTLLTTNIDGVIVLNEDKKNPSVTRLEKEGKAVIYVNCTSNKSRHRVNVDNRAGAALATEYLLQNGHKKIAFLNGSLKTLSGSERFKGCRDVLKKHGILDKILKANLFRNTEYNQKMAYSETVDIFSKRTTPTAIFAASDWMALGAMNAIREKGLSIPDDVSIVGFDNTMLSSQVTPSLTTVRQPLIEMGEEAMKGIIKINEEPGITYNRVLMPELIIRESTRFIDSMYRNFKVCQTDQKFKKRGSYPRKGLIKN